MYITYKGNVYRVETEWDVRYFFLAIFDDEEGE